MAEMTGSQQHKQASSGGSGSGGSSSGSGSGGGQAQVGPGVGGCSLGLLRAHLCTRHLVPVSPPLLPLMSLIDVDKVSRALLHGARARFV